MPVQDLRKDSGSDTLTGSKQDETAFTGSKQDATEVRVTHPRPLASIRTIYFDHLLSVLFVVLPKRLQNTPGFQGWRLLDFDHWSCCHRSLHHRSSQEVPGWRCGELNAVMEPRAGRECDTALRRKGERMRLQRYNIRYRYLNQACRSNGITHEKYYIIILYIYIYIKHSPHRLG